MIRIYGDVSMWVHLWGVSMGCIYRGISTGVYLWGCNWAMAHFDLIILPM